MFLDTCSFIFLNANPSSLCPACASSTPKLPLNYANKLENKDQRWFFPHLICCKFSLFPSRRNKTKISNKSTKCNTTLQNCNLHYCENRSRNQPSWARILCHTGRLWRFLSLPLPSVSLHKTQLPYSSSKCTTFFARWRKQIVPYSWATHLNQLHEVYFWKPRSWNLLRLRCPTVLLLFAFCRGKYEITLWKACLLFSTKGSRNVWEGNGCKCASASAAWECASMGGLKKTSFDCWQLEFEENRFEIWTEAHLGFEFFYLKIALSS